MAYSIPYKYFIDPHTAVNYIKLSAAAFLPHMLNRTNT